MALKTSNKNRKKEQKKEKLKNHTILIEEKEILTDYLILTLILIHKVEVLTTTMKANHLKVVI